MDALLCKVVLYFCSQMAIVRRQIAVIQFRELVSVYTVTIVYGIHLDLSHMEKT